MNTLFKFKKADGFDVFYLDYDNELMQLTYTQSEFILFQQEDPHLLGGG